MDIQNLTNVSTVVINSLLMLLKDNHVDVNYVVMQLSNNKDQAISPEVNLGDLTQQTLDELQKAKAQKVAVPEGFVVVPVESLKVALFWMDENIDPWQMGGDTFKDLFEHKPVLEKAVIEAQEQV